MCIKGMAVHAVTYQCLKLSGSLSRQCHISYDIPKALQIVCIGIWFYNRTIYHMFCHVCSETSILRVLLKQYMSPTSPNKFQRGITLARVGQTWKKSNLICITSRQIHIQCTKLQVIISKDNRKKSRKLSGRTDRQTNGQTDWQTGRKPIVPSWVSLVGD